MSFLPPETPQEVARRLNSVHEKNYPVRQLNAEEVRLLEREWRRCKKTIGEPLHVWLGWTEGQLAHWQATGLVPDAEAS